MIAVVNHIKAHNRESFETIINNFRDRSRLVDRFEGFRGFRLMASTEDLEIMVITFWEDREAFKRWVESEEFKRGHSRARRSRIEADSRGVIYDIILDL